MKPIRLIWGRIKQGRIMSVAATLLIVVASVWAVAVWANRVHVGSRMHALGMTDATDSMVVPYNYIKLGWWEWATQQLKERSGETPESVESHLILGMVSEVNNEWEEARDAYDRLLAVPDLDRDVRGAVYALIGRSLLKDSEINLAKTYFYRSIEESETMATAHNGLGIALAHEGDVDMALTYFEKAHELAPDWLEPIVWAASLYNADDRYRDALSVLLPNNELGGRDHSFQYELAVAYEKLYILTVNDRLGEEDMELIRTFRIDEDDLSDTIKQLALAAADRGLKLTPDNVNLLTIKDRLK